MGVGVPVASPYASQMYAGPTTHSGANHKSGEKIISYTAGPLTYFTLFFCVFLICRLNTSWRRKLHRERPVFVR